MKQKKLILLMLFCAFTGFLYAQTPVRGNVIDDQGTLVENASVTVEGKSIGTQTDANGNFSIALNRGETLSISAVGHVTQKVVYRGQSEISVVLQRENKELSAVVVTALGIKKQERGLGYSVSDLSSTELMKNKNVNLVNSLAGKVPGVNVTQFSGAAGAGASITIRGGNSTSDSRQNQPLFVVDGIIYDNSTSVVGNTLSDGVSRSNTTYGNRVMDINPDDIASLTVLKGAAAAALYGSRAADGVVIITTKTGVAGVTKVGVNSRVTTSWANKIPHAQTTFGLGSYSNNGVLNNSTSYNSWGPKLAPSDTTYNNIGDFFQNGLIYDNNVSVSGGSKNGSFFLSGSNFYQKGIIPVTDYNKSTFRLNVDQKFGKFKVSANVAYSIADTRRTLTTAGLWAGGGNGAMGAVYSWPQVFNMKNYKNPDGTQNFNLPALEPSASLDNPYWIINEDKLTSKTDRFTGGVNLNYEVTKWWDVTGRVGYDRYTTADYTYIAPGSAISDIYKGGRLSKDNLTYTFITSTLMSNFHKKFGDFDTHIMVGTTNENTERLNLIHWGYDFITAGTVSFANIPNINEFFTDATVRQRLIGAFGEAGISYKDMVYLTATGRNDWSSTLPIENRSYFYPSLSGSFVFTQLLKPSDVLSFGKIRGSWAQVGKDANPYQTLTSVTQPITYGSFTGVGNFYVSGNPFLIPEIQRSWEVGAELKFFNGRLGLDYTYYESKTRNQIAQPRLSNASGYILTSINSGSVINKGMEIALNGQLVTRKDFDWNATINFSYNRGRLGQFLPGVAFFYPTDAQFGTVRAASIPNGGYFLGMTGTTYLKQTDANGKEMVNGENQVDPTTGLYKINTTNPVVGNREPAFIGGFNSTMRYKDFTFSFLLDIRKGGIVYNGTEYAMVMNGLSKQTLAGDRQSVTVKGVNSQTGAPFEQTYSADQTYNINGVSMDGKSMIQQYWWNYGANTFNFIQNVNWLKLRAISLSYDFTDLIRNQKVVKGLNASITGNNLFTITNYKGMDPEVSAAGGTGGSGSTGIDYMGVPAVASFTFGVNVTF